MEWRFQRQRQVAKILNYLFPHTMQLTDTELEDQAENLQKVYASDLDHNLVSEARAFRREFRAKMYRYKDEYALFNAGSGNCLHLVLHIASVQRRAQFLKANFDNVLLTFVNCTKTIRQSYLDQHEKMK